MNAQNFLPPIPRPPHDPTSWLLNGRVGWHEYDFKTGVEKSPLSGSLVLKQVPGSGRSLTEAGGSFGGLTVPAHVAPAPDGSIYLLDADTLALKRFDPCECVFKTVPCFGGEGSGPRELRAPHGIGICAGNLFVCDTGNHRLSVFSLHGFVLRAHWELPDCVYDALEPVLTSLWEPYDVAFDERGRVYVSDGANGCIHRFTPSGCWETSFAGFVKVTHIAIDCMDRLVVAMEGVEHFIKIVDTDGKFIDTVDRPEALAQKFLPLPFVVDAAGNLHLGALCAEAEVQGCDGAAQPAPERGVFDLHGNPVKPESVPVAPAPVYEKEGFYYGRALDSELYRCQWHRIVLRGEVPAGTGITASTYTAETLLSDDAVQGLPADAWETGQTLKGQSEKRPSEWDCLIRSGGGRYLWLKLEFRSNGKATPALESSSIEFPRVSLRRYLPTVFGAEPVSADFTDRFLSLFDTTLRSIERKLDTQARYFDPLATPVDFLTWLGSWIGLALDRHWPEAKRRQFLKRAGRLYDLRGTREGLRQQLLLYLSTEPEQNCCPGDQPKRRCRLEPHNCEPVMTSACAWQPPPLILEYYQLRRWLFLGAARLGDQAVLWGKRIVNRAQLNEGAQVGNSQLKTIQDPYRDPFHVYAHKFAVFVPAHYGRDERQRKALDNLLRTETPAHTYHQLEYVEPRFRIGFQSMIGFDTVIARLPQGVTLNETRLGPASVLGAPPHKHGGPSFEIGKEGRIGTTTTLS